MAMTRMQKQVLAGLILDHAGNIVEFFGESDTLGKELKDAGVTSQEVAEVLGKWLHRLPGKSWDSRLVDPAAVSLVPKGSEQGAVAKDADAGGPKTVSTEAWWKLFHEREAMLDAMPGGAQGAQPDMSDVIDEAELNPE